jgi:hypothetical protein
VTVSRRAFLGAAAGGVVAVALWWAARDGGSDLPPGAADRMAAFLADPDGARRLGEAARAADPRGALELATALAPAGADPQTWYARVDDAAFAAHVRGRVDDDFAAGRTATVHGWWLARTEAELCALWSFA